MENIRVERGKNRWLTTDGKSIQLLKDHDWIVYVENKGYLANRNGSVLCWTTKKAAELVAECFIDDRATYAIEVKS